MKNATTHWCVERLDTSIHERAEFDCGQADLTRYLKRYAGQDSRRGLSRVFVLCRQDEALVHGYYTLSAVAIGKDEESVQGTNHLPYDLIPAILIGRLGISQHQQKKGLGGVLLFDALQRCWCASQVVGVHAVIVDAKDEQASMFYQHFGFKPLTSMPNRLWLVMSSIERLIQEAQD